MGGQGNELMAQGCCSMLSLKNQHQDHPAESLRLFESIDLCCNKFGILSRQATVGGEPLAY